MASPEAAEETAHRLQREQRASQVQRQSNLEQSLAPFRVGSVPYLNTVPLTRGLEDQVIYATPAKLARMLQREELDAALVSVVEVLFNDRYEILDGIAIASLGEVKSVLLAHREPIEQVAEVFCDTASLTSVELLRVLLAERGLNPQFKPLASYDFATLPDYALLIGDPALDLLFGSAKVGQASCLPPVNVAPHLSPPADHHIWDLGEAWYELTRLPFVYAVWAIRRGIQNAPALRRQLREARDFGLDTLDWIIQSRTEYDYGFRKDYLGWHIHYHLGADEKRGLAKFSEMLRKHSDREVFEPRFVV